MQRRDFIKLLGVAAGAGLLASCKATSEASFGNNLPFFGRNGAGFDKNGSPATPISLESLGYKSSAPAATGSGGGATRTAYARDIPGPCPYPVEAIGRGVWRADGPIASRLLPMGEVTRVTVHHEGSPQGNWDGSATAVAQTLRRIQDEHRRRLQAADIGYHYIIDRSGRVWQGRSHLYQGAHVRSCNPHNLGIMVLGNFDTQQPTQQQVTSLGHLCHMLLHGYGIPVSRLKDHGDLANTRCPGRNLRPYVAKIAAQVLYA